MSNREGEREWDHKTQQQDNLNVLLHPRCVVYNANDARLASGCGFSEWTDWLQHITRGMKRSLQQIEKYTFPSSWLSSALVRRYLDYLLCCPSPFHPPRQSGWVLLSWIVYFRVCRKYTIPFALSVTPSRRVVCVCSADKWVYERPSESDWYHRGINQTRSATAAAERETSEGTKIRSKNEVLSYLNPVRYQDKTKPLT